MANEDLRVSNQRYTFECDLSAISSLFGSFLVSFDSFTPQETVQQSSEDKMKIEKERKEREKKEVLLSSKKSALDRFKK